MSRYIALFSGILFGSGLAISGMTDTRKVIGFLDIFGDWDASLLFVMGTALIVVLPSFYLIQKMRKPVIGKEFCLPTNKLIDSNLAIGSIIFGIGWGLYGYCPGPAISSLVYLNTESFLFVAAMLAGMYLANHLKRSSN